MKNILLFILILLFCKNSFAQKLSLSDLQIICNKTNWEYINQFLSNKGWEYYESEKGSSTKYNTITWSFNKSSYDDKAEAWFYLYTFEGYPNKISYSVFNKSSYSVIQKSLTSTGYNLVNSEIADNELISNYANSKFILKITTEKREREYEESLTGYEFLLIKKSGVYDPDNGKKTDYYYGDVKKSEYTLKNGEMHGAATVYHENGSLAVKGNFTNGKANGLFIKYDEAGNLLTKYTMRNDLKNGLLESYENNKISYSTNYLDDLRNGQYMNYYYNDTGNLVAKEYGQYLNDEKNGTWKVFVVEDGRERLLNFTNYKKNIKNGSFQHAKGDSLIIGSYKFDKLNGEYKIYRDFVKTLFGGIIRSDTSKLTLVSDGRYYEDEKSGYWKNYDLTGALRNEGRYISNKRSGEWKYYYSRMSGEGGKNIHYSEELFLIETFSKGYLEGKSTRYSYLSEETFPCSEIDENKNPLDTCRRNVYKKIFETSFFKNNKLNGPYELRDSLDMIISKGNYLNNLETGEWTLRSKNLDENGEDYFIYERGNYFSGKREGEWIEYLEDGHITYTVNYSNGELHGELIKWNKYQKPNEKKIFSKGKFKGVIYFDSLGINPVEQFEIYSFSPQYSSFKCKKITYYSNGETSTQEYRVNKEPNTEINHHWFRLSFILARIPEKETNKANAQKDGDYLLYDNKNRVIMKGEYSMDEKAGVWTVFYYDKNVKVSTNKNISSSQRKEHYLTLDEELFTGEFIFYDKVNNIKEIRKIKNGLRNGKTVYIDLKTGKITKKENYKKGIKK